MGPPAAAALRKIAKLDFQTTPAHFVVEHSGSRTLRQDTVREFRRRLGVIKTELLKVRNVLLGTKPLVTRPITHARPGRPKIPRITAAMRILKEGMLKSTDLSHRAHWEAIFENQVVTQCIEGFDKLDEEGKKAAKKNLRQALRARGGIGKPPEEN
jgi:hypothetical protein